MKKIFFAVVTMFVLFIAMTVPAFAETATLYNTKGELCNLWGGQVQSVKKATFEGTVYDNDGKKFFYNDNGTDPTNVWVKIGDEWHYAGADCYFVKDKWVKFGSKKYYLDANGNIADVAFEAIGPSSVIGWKKLENGKWRYYDNNSNYLTGWQKLKWSKGTDWFYFGKNGYMYAKDWTPDGYYVNADGVWDGYYYSCPKCGAETTTKAGDRCSECRKKLPH